MWVLVMINFSDERERKYPEVYKAQGEKDALKSHLKVWQHVIFVLHAVGHAVDVSAYCQQLPLQRRSRADVHEGGFQILLAVEAQGVSWAPYRRRRSIEGLKSAGE